MNARVRIAFALICAAPLATLWCSQALATAVFYLRRHRAAGDTPPLSADESRRLAALFAGCRED